MTTYESSGVNIKYGDSVSEILYNASKATWDIRKFVLGEVISPFDSFSGLRYIDVSNLPNGTALYNGYDGIGSKTEIAERTKNHRYAAFDLLAMVCDDAVVKGFEPVIVGSDLQVKSLTRKDGKPFLDEVNQLAEGYVNAAKMAQVVILNGETAELPTRVKGYGEFNYNWSAGVIGFGNKERLFTGFEIKEGDYLIGLYEHGFRSNGISLLRKIMEETKGKNWHKKRTKFELKETYGELLNTPSTIYSTAIVDLFGGYNLERNPRAEIHGVVNITGGGIPGKLGRVLKPSGMGAIIDTPWEIRDITREIIDLGKIKSKEANKTWCMNNGMIVITPEPDRVIDIILENGINSKKIGRVVKEQGIKLANILTDSKKKPYFVFEA
ncbi:MAG: AIR synthase-related protein [Candidatus Pacearchaeota archaeon]|jgi:phosphoribosylformylglycinamidine cyclo-ligase